MVRIKQLVDSMWRQYSASGIEMPASAFTPRLLPPVIGDEPSEDFHLAFHDGDMQLTAKSPIAAVYGLSQAIAAMRTGYLSEVLGQNSPRYPLRPLWVGGKKLAALKEGNYLVIPEGLSSLDDDEIEGFCSQLLSFGFNTFVGTLTDGPGEVEDEASLSSILELFSSFGVQVILRLQLKALRGCPLNPSYREQLKKAIPKVEIPYLYIESSLGDPSYDDDSRAADSTTFELLLAELHLFEEMTAGNRLLFSLSESHEHQARKRASWLRSLCDYAAGGTIILFPASSSHFWQELRRGREKVETPLLPLVNCDDNDYSNLDSLFLRMNPSEFTGALMAVPALPQDQQYLYTAGQLLWREGAAASFVETWQLANRSS